MRFNVTCPRCGGTGHLRNMCKTCGGEGRVRRADTIDVRIPPGMQTGSRVRVPGKGNVGTLGAPPGDLYIILDVQPHPFFERRGDDIYTRVPISVSEAALGAKIEVPTIDGRAVLRVPPGSSSGRMLRLREKGVPLARTPSRRGDQYVELQVMVPDAVDERVRTLAERAGAAGAGRPAARFIYARGRVRRVAMAAKGKKKARAGYMISAVATLYKIHPQTLRLYERVGLLKPSRSLGNTRLYTDADLERLDVILNLAREMGVNLAGIEIILNMRDKMNGMQRQMEQFIHFVQQELGPAMRSRSDQTLSRGDCESESATRNPRSQIISTWRGTQNFASINFSRAVRV